MFAPEVTTPLDEVFEPVVLDSGEGFSDASLYESFESDPAAVAAALAEAPEATLKRVEGSPDPLVRAIARSTRRIRTVAQKLRNPKASIQRRRVTLGAAPRLAPDLSKLFDNDADRVRALTSSARGAAGTILSDETRNHMVAGFDPVELSAMLVAASLGSQQSSFWPNRAVEGTPEREVSARDIVQGTRGNLLAFAKVQKEVGRWTGPTAKTAIPGEELKLSPSQSIVHQSRSALTASGALDLQLAQERIQGDALNNGRLLEVAGTEVRIELEKLRVQALMGDGPSIFAYYRLKKREAELALQHAAAVERSYQAAA